MLVTLPIRELVPATPRATIVRLALNGHRFEYTAGQAVLVAPHGSERRRPYSIAIAPEDAQRTGQLELLVGTDADTGDGSRLELEIGATLDVEGPVGTFTFPASPVERNFVFVAGGTGIAPLRAMLRHVMLGPEPQHVGLLYSARTPTEFAYQDEFRALAERRLIELRQTVTRAPAGTWSGPRGRIDRAALAELVHDPRTLCFICGPAAMVDEIPRLLEDIGVDRSRIRIEEW